MMIYWSFNDCTDQPNTLLSKPHVNKFALQWLSSAHATPATIRLWPCRLDLGNLANRCPDKSYSRTFLLSCGIAMIPLEDTDRRLTAESPLIVATGDLIFLRSHTLTFLSSELDTTLSSFVNTADVTLLEV